MPHICKGWTLHFGGSTNALDGRYSFDVLQGCLKAVSNLPARVP